MTTAIRRRRTSEPVVSVIVATRDRPLLFALAVEYYRRQTYAPRELIVVDDGQRHPVPSAVVEAVGGRLLRLPEPTALGTKLNLGAEDACGRWCIKIDDDDFYAPRYVETLVRAVEQGTTRRPRPTLAFMSPPVFFDVATWQTRRADGFGIPGSGLLFGRQDWQATPFKPISQHEDIIFVREQMELGAVPMPLFRPGSFVVVRHEGSGDQRGHSWTRHSRGGAVEHRLLDMPIYRTPEAVLPRWALRTYRSLQRTLLQRTARPQWTLSS